MSDNPPFAQVFLIIFSIFTLAVMACLIADALILRRRLNKYNFDGLEAEKPIKKSRAFVQAGMMIFKPLFALTLLFLVASLVTENIELHEKNATLTSTLTKEK